MNGFDVCVRGAGAVGMSLALALSRQGLRVALQQDPARDVALGGEQSKGPASDIRTYALNAGSVRLLSDLKVWDAIPADARTPLYDMHVCGDGAGAVLHFSAFEQGLDVLAWIVDAAELEIALAAALRFAPHVERVEQPVSADLLAIAEGRFAPSAAALGVQFTRQPYAQRAIAARLESDIPHAGLARQWFGAPDVLALLPFDRPAPGRSFGLVWSVPDQRAEELLALPPAAFEQALMDASGGAAGSLRLASELAAWPLQWARAEPLCGPGWVLLGDAAHVVHPLAGQGLNLGLADVSSLVRVLAARESYRGIGDEKLLRRHVRERALPTRAMGLVTDGLLQLFAQPGAPARELRNRGLSLLNSLSPLKKWIAAQAAHS